MGRIFVGSKVVATRDSSGKITPKENLSKNESKILAREMSGYEADQARKKATGVITADTKAKAVLDVIDPREASRVTQTISSRTSSTPTQSTTIQKGNTEYIDKRTGQGVSMLPEYADKDPNIVSRGEYYVPETKKDPYREAFESQVRAETARRKEYVTPSGQPVQMSIAPEEAKKAGYITRAEYEKRQVKPPTVATVQDTSRRSVSSPTATSGATLRAATAEEKKAIRSGRVKEYIGELYAGAKAGFLGETMKAAPATQTGQRGYELGLLATIVPIGRAESTAAKGATLLDDVARFGDDVFRASKPAAKKAAQAAGKAATKAKTVYQATQRTRIGRFLKDVGVVTAEGVAISETGKAITEGTAPAEQKAIAKSAGFDEAIGAGFAAEREALKQEAWYKAIGFEISPYFSTRKDVYETTVRQELQKQGFSGSQLEAGVAAAKRQRKGITISEAVANLNVARASEKIGRREVANVLEKATGEVIPKNRAFVEMFKLTAPSIAQAGAVEGFAQEVTQQKAREQDLNLKSAAIMGGAGALSAGLIGGTIAGTRATKPGVSKVIEYGTYITDPFEKPGDLAQDLSEAITRRITKKAPRTPVITETLGAEDFFNIRVSGKTPSKPKSSILQAGTIIGTPAQTPTKTQTPVKTKTVVNMPTMPSIFGGVPITVPSVVPVPTDTETPVDVPIEVPTDTNVPTNINTNIFESIFNTESNVPVSTGVPINIPINIPTVTPQLRVPPPIPVQFPAASGGAGTAIGKRKKYVNELAAGFGYLNNVLGVPQRRNNAKPKKMSKRKKKKKR